MSAETWPKESQRMCNGASGQVPVMSAEQTEGGDYAERVSPRLLQTAFTHLRPFCGGADPRVEHVIAYAHTLALLHIADHIGDHGDMLRDSLVSVSDAVAGLSR